MYPRLTRSPLSKSLLLVPALALLLLAGAWARPGDALAACTGERFTDVCPSDWFYPFVMDLTGGLIVTGYEDNTFRPYNTMTRSQAMKAIVNAVGLQAELPSTNTFADVPTNHPFYFAVEVGAANGLTSGYNCGGAGEPCDTANRPYFRPFAEVVRGQLAKMVVVAKGWQPLEPETATFSDVSLSNPFFAFVERAVEQEVISGYEDGTFKPFTQITRAQAAKIISISRQIEPTPTVTGTPPTATPTRTRTATPTPTRTPVAGSGPTIAGCPVFPANNIWNRRVNDLPVHPLSAQYIASIGLTRGVHPDFGSGTWEGRPIGIPYTTVPGTQPGVDVTFRYDPESDRPPYPIPPDAPIEGGADADGDRHILIIDRDNCVLHELFDAWPNGDGSWTAGSGARWSLLSNALRPSGWTSADAAGLPMFPGLARYEEVAAGAILHALRFTAPRTQKAFVWPGRHHASDITDPNVPPMGLRVRLKASVDISGYSTQTRIVLQALKDYGMFLADNGSPWYISGIPDERWDNNSLVNELDDIVGSDFEAVDLSGVMVDPNSGESR